MSNRKEKVAERRRRYLEFVEQLDVREDDVTKESFTDLLAFVFPEHFTKVRQNEVGLDLNAVSG